jgi:hypothetical protein
MITHELAKIWITSDGKRFLDKDKAIEYEKHIQKEKMYIEELYERYNEEL